MAICLSVFSSFSWMTSGFSKAKKCVFCFLQPRERAKIKNEKTSRKNSSQGNSSILKVNSKDCRKLYPNYIVIPSPYLKLEKSEALTDPEAVKVTLGAMSFFKEAERRPLPPTTEYFALTIPKGAV